MAVLGSYLINPGVRSRTMHSGGVVILDGSAVQGVACCDCALQWKRRYAPAPAKWKQEWLTEACLAQQQRIEAWMTQLTEADCRTENFFDAGEQLIRDEKGLTAQTAMLAVFSAQKDDSLTITPLAVGPGMVCLLTPLGGLTVLAKEHFALQTTAASSCLVLLMDRTVDHKALRTLLQWEQGLLSALLQSPNPEQFRRAASTHGLRMAVAWGWADYGSMQADFRQRLDKVSALLSHLEKLPEAMTEKILRQFGAGE